jgi:pimeloyl-ACP methyl ester carboxylesterase
MTTARPDAAASSHRTLPDPVPGVRRDIDGRAGRVAVFAAGEGPPMLLLHSINAAASAYEVRPVFERMLASHRVFAPDLPGFGASERSDRRYDAALYGVAIDEVLDAIAHEAGDAAVDVLALSLSAEFAARAAVRRPARFRTLAMVTPTGLDRRSDSLRAEPGADREIRGVHRAVSMPLWSQALFDLLVSRPSVRFFLRRTFGSRDIDEGLLDYSWRTAHQPGARHAPLVFLSGRLFSRDIRDVYERLALPVWVPHATRGDFKDFGGALWTRSRANWTVQPWATGALPHVEQPDAFADAYRRFLAG